MLIFDFLSIETWNFNEDAPLRLRDLIAGLGSGAVPASFILDRLDPGLADEVHAVVAHRGQTPESFLAKCLAGFALDAADEAWRRLVERSAPVDGDTEAGAFSHLLSEAVRRALSRDIRLPPDKAGRSRRASLGRRIGTA